MPKELHGPPKVLFGQTLSGQAHSFSDVAKKVVSIINLASVAAVENAAGAPVHPLRFRGNIYVAGWPAWHEFDLLGREIAIGESARLKVVKRIERCAATEVDPETGIRDLTIPRTLMDNFGHADCGIYAEVIAGGDIAVGDAINERPADKAGRLDFQNAMRVSARRAGGRQAQCWQRRHGLGAGRLLTLRRQARRRRHRRLRLDPEQFGQGRIERQITPQCATDGRHGLRCGSLRDLPRNLLHRLRHFLHSVMRRRRRRLCRASAGLRMVLLGLDRRHQFADRLVDAGLGRRAIGRALSTLRAQCV